jgi:hypothetical protein
MINQRDTALCELGLKISSTLKFGFTLVTVLPTEELKVQIDLFATTVVNKMSQSPLLLTTAT